jgi:RimJ/RimL family protein N-acetyltransferase
MKENELDYSHYFWQGEKVRLRPLRLEDAEQGFIESLDTPSRRVLQLGVELPTSIELQKVALEKYVGCKDTDGVIIFRIDTMDGDPVGAISYHSRSKKNGTFSFGVSIDRKHWGNGYAVDAIRILLRYGFQERRYQKCNSACLVSNTASIRLHQKLGFLEEGRRRRQFFMDGEFQDEVLFGLTRQEFEEQGG